MVNICMFQADEGDFLWVGYGKNIIESHILIDGGTKYCGEKYAEVIKKINLKGQKIEAIILTHIDCDHLDGVCDGISRVDQTILMDTVKKIIFNSSQKSEIKVEKQSKQYGVKEEILFENIIHEKGLDNCLISGVVLGTQIELAGGAMLKIISPGERELIKLGEKGEKYREKKKSVVYAPNLDQVRMDLDELMNEPLRKDSSVNNASSIAFIFEFMDVKGVFLGDALPSVCVRGVHEFGLSQPIEVIEDEIINIRKEIRIKNNEKNKQNAIFIESREKLENLLKSYFSQSIMNEIYMKIEPHEVMKNVDYHLDFNEKDEPELSINAVNSKDDYCRPEIYFSTAQLNTVAFSSFFSRALDSSDLQIQTICVDDPIGHFDDMNILGFTDMIRSILETKKCQIIMSTHDEKIFQIMERKLSSTYYNSKFIKLTESGAVTWKHS